MAAMCCDDDTAGNNLAVQMPGIIATHTYSIGTHTTNQVCEKVASDSGLGTGFDTADSNLTVQRPGIRAKAEY